MLLFRWFSGFPLAINGGTQFGIIKQSLVIKHLKLLNHYYEKFSLCFTVCNDLHVADKLPISG